MEKTVAVRKLFLKSSKQPMRVSAMRVSSLSMKGVTFGNLDDIRMRHFVLSEYHSLKN